MKKSILLCFVAFFLASFYSNAQVIKIAEVKVSNLGLYFDGSQVADPGSYVDQPAYDFRFGRVITPHGDCIEVFGKYVFLSWYKGGEEVRNVMLSRYNTETGELATIEFTHRHTGFQNNPHIGESHNTIAVGICPLDSTIHLLYDMHAYSETRPADGSLANDYFRYQYSVRGAASVPDDQFTESLFFPKRLFLKEGENYKGLTYPDFFINLNDELMVKMREGGHTNGKYMFAKYNPEDGWNDWTDFNVLSASNTGEINYNWGLYGDIKYIAGKMRIGFSTRYGINTDRYYANNGFHYSYSNDPSGKTGWHNAADEPFDLPLIDPDFIKISEPGDVVGLTGIDQVRITSGANWAVNDREDIHFVTRVNSTNAHTYKKASDTEFTTSTNFPGGDLYGIGNNMYLIGLENSRPVIHVAEGGTNHWNKIYNETSGKTFSHGKAIIKNGLLYYYLMERGSGDSRPIHLLVYNINDCPSDRDEDGIYDCEDACPDDPNTSCGIATIIPGKIEAEAYKSMSGVEVDTSGTMVTNINQGDWLEYMPDESSAGLYEVSYRLASASELIHFELLSDGSSISTINAEPTGSMDAFTLVMDTVIFATSPQKIAIHSLSNSWNFDWFEFVLLDAPPVVSFNNPTGDTVLIEGYDSFLVDVNVLDEPGTIANVQLFVDNTLIGIDSDAPYQWGNQGQADLLDLAIGDHIIKALAIDFNGLAGEASFVVSVVGPCAADSDGDGLNDCEDQCPDDPDHLCGYVAKIPGRIEVEAYSSMSGVKIDASGHYLFYIGDWDWMEYQLAESSAGLYEVSYKLAAASVPVRFELLADGNPVKMVNAEPTGSFATFVIVKDSVLLTTSPQTIGIQSLSNSWNFDWIEFDKLDTVLTGLATISQGIETFNIMPNPLVNSVTIEFGLEMESPVNLSVFDVQGKLVDALYQGRTSAGMHRLTWDGTDANSHLLSNGIYILRLTTEDEAITRKISIIR